MNGNNFWFVLMALFALAGCEPAGPQFVVYPPSGPPVGQCVTYQYAQVVNGRTRWAPLEYCVVGHHSSFGTPIWILSPSSAPMSVSSPADCASMWTQHEQWIASTPFVQMEPEFQFRLGAYTRACGAPNEQQAIRQADLLRDSGQRALAAQQAGRTAASPAATPGNQCETLRQQIVAASMIPPSMANVQFATVSALQAQFYAMGCR
jgi:hypothetical protein